MLTDAMGLLLSIGAFEGNCAETRAMLSMIQRLAKVYSLDDITIVVDTDMFSASNKKSIVDAGLHYILGTKEREILYLMAMWRKAYLGEDYSDEQIWELADQTERGDDGVAHSMTYNQCQVAGFVNTR